VIGKETREQEWEIGSSSGKNDWKNEEDLDQLAELEWSWVKLQTGLAVVDWWVQLTANRSSEEIDTGLEK
jgi:hypothetical protein